jgi:hypothetical protein
MDIIERSIRWCCNVSTPCQWPRTSRQAPEYIRHYYSDEFFPAARADTLTTLGHLHAELRALRAAGATDANLYPTSGGLEQVGLLAEALRNTGFLPAHDHG